MKNTKRKISKKLKSTKCTWLYKVAQYVNFICFHWEERMRMMHPGNEDKDKTYYVINPRDKTEGLLSTYYYVLSNVKWAKSKGYIPYVNFENANCQYFVDRIINNTNNAWEYYFTQPVEGLTKAELNKKRNVIQSGWHIFNQIPVFEKTLESARKTENLELTTSILKIQPYILEIVDETAKKEFEGKKVLGVFIRGTDYISLKPKGHPIQPNIDQVVEKTKEYVAKYRPDKIFVVTEDKGYFEKLDSIFNGLVFSSDYEFAEEYDSKGFISDSFNSDPYDRGLKYLIRLLLLNKCDYLVSSITNGSLFSFGLKKNDYDDSYWFELGKYQ